MHPAAAADAAERCRSVLQTPIRNHGTDLSLIGQVCFFAEKERNHNARKI